MMLFTYMKASFQLIQTKLCFLAAFNLFCILQTWNNIIAIQFKDEDCTKQWRQTFTLDFEGKYKKV